MPPAGGWIAARGIWVSSPILSSPPGEIVGCFDVTRSAVSQHLTVLKNAGPLTERKVATRRLYRARPEGLAGLREFLDQMWASSAETERDLAAAAGGRA